MAKRSTTGEYQPSPPSTRSLRSSGGSRNGGRQGRTVGIVAAGTRTKGNVMASGGAPSATKFGGGTARGAVRMGGSLGDQS
jgi:hypothetical protein